MTEDFIEILFNVRSKVQDKDIASANMAYAALLNTVTQRGVVYIFQVPKGDVPTFEALCDERDMLWEWAADETVATFRVSIPPTPEQVQRWLSATNQ